jgi:hypothetical protein
MLASVEVHNCVRAVHHTPPASSVQVQVEPQTNGSGHTQRLLPACAISMEGQQGKKHSLLHLKLLRTAALCCVPLSYTGSL